MNSKYEAIRANTIDGVIIIDEQGVIKEINDSVEKLFGYPSSRVLGKNIKMLMPEKYRIRHEESIKSYIKYGETKIIGVGREVEGKKKDGKIFPMYLQISEILVDEKRYFLGICRDLSLKKQLELSKEKYSKAERFRKSILDSSYIGIICFDAFGIIREWNLKATEILGLEANTMVGEDFFRRRVFGLNLKIEKIGQDISIFFNNKPILNSMIEVDCVNKNGSLVPLELKVSTFKVKDEKFFTVFFKDVTELKIIEDQLRQSQKLESIGQLAAGIAHEINTPLQYIGQNNRFLEDAFNNFQLFTSKFMVLTNGNLKNEEFVCAVLDLKNNYEKCDLKFFSDEIPIALKQSQEGISRVSKIVKGLKEFSYPGNEIKLADINKAIETTVNISKNEWKYVAELKLNLKEKLSLVLCDVGLINQVILNLIINSAHAIKEKGHGHKGEIKIWTQESPKYIELYVEDNGIGIEEKIRQKIFDPFFTTKKVGKGTGQGLYLVYSIIKEKHKGKVSFNTEYGKGTTFIIKIPKNKPETRHD